MYIELKVATNWITQKIKDNLISPETGLLPSEVSQAQIDQFCAELFYAMLHDYAPDWDPFSPLKGQQNRAIRIHSEKYEAQHSCIYEALKASGLTYESLRLHELWFDLIINPGLVFHEQEGDYLYDKIHTPLADLVEVHPKMVNKSLKSVYGWDYESVPVRRRSITRMTMGDNDPSHMQFGLQTASKSNTF